MWECGLKQLTRADIADGAVTPHVGVWIETKGAYPWIPSCRVTPHVGVWIETSIVDMDDRSLRHSPCGSVDWNTVTVDVGVLHGESLPMWDSCLLRKKKQVMRPTWVKTKNLMTFNLPQPLWTGEHSATWAQVLPPTPWFIAVQKMFRNSGIMGLFRSLPFKGSVDVRLSTCLFLISLYTFFFH